MCFRSFDSVPVLAWRADATEVAGGFNSMLRAELYPERTAHQVWYILQMSFYLSGRYKDSFIQKRKIGKGTSSK